LGFYGAKITIFYKSNKFLVIFGDFFVYFSQKVVTFASETAGSERSGSELVVS